MKLDFELAGTQIDGARDYQEDAFLITHLTDTDGNPSSLVIVADGMGGHAAGNVASNMAVQAFNKHVSSHYPTLSVSKILEEAVDKANMSIRETIEETPALRGMGCTMVGAILEKGKIWWASVGDSHIYLVRESGIAKVNQDHSYGGFLDRMEAAGKFIEPDAGLTRNMLMSAITGEEVNEIDCPDTPRELYPSDRILLCTDGMDTLSNGKILEHASKDSSPKECVDSLIQAVVDAEMPRQDNTTAIIVHIDGSKDENKVAAPATKTKSNYDDVEISPEAVDVASSKAEQNDTFQPHYDRTEDDEKSYTGVIIATVAMLVLIGIGAYFFLYGLPSSETEEITTTETAPPVVETTGTQEEMEEEVEEIEEIEEIVVPEEEVREIIEEEESVPVVSRSIEKFSDKLKSGSKGPTMVKIPGGQFKMGNSNTTRYASEQPVHSVTIEPFAISEHEVTFAQYDRFAKATGRRLPKSLGLGRSDHPVFYVNWNDAVQYAKWLSGQTGHAYQLPTEAQWEHAATANSDAPFPWGFDEIQGKAHCFSCGSKFPGGKPTKVGSFAANANGLFDMNGNVAEWVQECWHRNYTGAPATAEVWKDGDCSYRVVRGGAFSSPQSSLRNHRRDKYGAKNSYDNIGFRVVRILN